MGGRGRQGSGRERGRKRKSGAGSDIGGDGGEVERVRKLNIEWRCVAVGDGELRVATRKFQMLGTQDVPRTQQG